MLSPFTKPGTKVVCIDAEGSDKYGGTYGAFNGEDARAVLRKNEIYTVAEIGLYKGRLKPSVMLEEYPWWTGGFALERFRPAALPKAIMDTLVGVPIDLCLDEIQRIREDENRRIRELMPPL